MTLELLVIVTIALSAGAIAKGATGMGLPLVALPVLASFIGVPHAIAVLIIPILVTNLWQIWQHRVNLRGTTFLLRFLGAAILGVIFGTWFLVTMPEKILALLLGLLVFSYILLRMIRPNFHVSEQVARRIGIPVGLAAGLLQGATGIGAPVGVTFLHSIQLHRERYVAAVSSMFLITTLVQLIALSVAEVITITRVLQGMYALIPVIVMMPVGAALGKRLNVVWFDRSILVFLSVVGAQLMYHSIS